MPEAAPDTTHWPDSVQHLGYIDPGGQAFLPTEFDRLWRGFMTARVTLGLALTALQVGLWLIGQTSDASLILVAALYLISALVVRLFTAPHQYGQVLTIEWLVTIGIDLATVSALQLLHLGSINYAPLLALTVLMASILGPYRLAVGTAAGTAFLLLAHASWLAASSSAPAAPVLVQAGLIAVGCFAIALLSSQLSVRLAEEERRGRTNRQAAQAQRRVNQMVIESMQDGVLVVDVQGMVRTANPSARKMLGSGGSWLSAQRLSGYPTWKPLADLVSESFAKSSEVSDALRIVLPGQRQSHLQARVSPITGSDGLVTSLCVVFLQDQREQEARMRTEKLASMGRMSAAVAHEIRNPLAAIVQANALLAEELQDKRLRELAMIVQKNALRLGRIVDEVLDAARARATHAEGSSPLIELDATVATLVEEWSLQNEASGRLQFGYATRGLLVPFDVEHLRRILVNLLDNAWRHSASQPGSVQVSTNVSVNGRGTLSVWSHSAPMEPSVERHLFEPFFSSQSRSSGLGLYICRELCEGHGAQISHERQEIDGLTGNLFRVEFRSTATKPAGTS
jgi:two-component system, NtrC family, sensor histidine kinase PilS